MHDTLYCFQALQTAAVLYHHLENLPCLQVVTSVMELVAIPLSTRRKQGAKSGIDDSMCTMYGHYAKRTQLQTLHAIACDQNGFHTAIDAVCLCAL